MSRSLNKEGDALPPPSSSTVVLLLMDIGNTTWRMFAPTLGLGVVGFWADVSWHMAPWLSCMGVVTGALIASLLIRQQLREISRG